MTDTWRRACTETGNCLEVRRVPGGIILRNSHDHTREVKATVEEWAAFVDQIKDGRFDADRHTPLSDEPCGVIPTRRALDYLAIRREQHPRPHTGGLS